MQFYRAGIESILIFGINVWYRNTSAQDRKRLDKMVRSASKIIGQELPTLSEISTIRLREKGARYSSGLNSPG